MKKSGPPRRPLRRIRALHRKLAQIDAEMAFREAENDDGGDETITHRKFLIGHAALEQAQRDPELITWLRSQLEIGLTRACDRELFHLDASRPLIPPEQWPAWPERDDTTPADSYTRMTPGRRRARLTSLRNLRKTICSELKELLHKDKPKRESTNVQRKIVVGAGLFKASLGKDTEVSRLRNMLDKGLSETADRALFQLEGDGPLVPEDLWPALQDTKAYEARPRDSDNAPPAADAQSTSQRPARSDRAGSPKATSAVGSRKADSVGTEGMPPAVQDPIPGWRPRRLPASSASDSEAGERQTEWGALLKGRAAVAALPADLVGKTIEVTDSNHSSWHATITEVVTRDDATITVRTSGRPLRDDGRSGQA